MAGIQLYKSKANSADVAVEAMRADIHKLDLLEQFVGGDVGGSANAMVVAGPAGAIRFKIGDYIVKDYDGNFTVINGDEFEREYEQAPY